jgi:glyoxylase-like metal-dependent hydrolase (beta-lactamase superfamily II)
MSLAIRLEARYALGPHRITVEGSMRRLILVIAVLASPLAGQAPQTPALDAVAAVLGGKDALLGVRTLVIEGNGDWPNHGQNYAPGASTTFEITAFRRVYDFTNGRWFFDQTRVPKFVAASLAPQRVRVGLDGDVAYNVSAGGATTRGSMQQVNDRRIDLLFHPVGFFQAAYAPGAEVVEEIASNNGRTIRVMIGGVPYVMTVNGVTGLPARIERPYYQPMYGDVRVYQDLGDWREVAGVRLPMRMTYTIEKGGVLQDYRVTRSIVNGAIEDLAAADSVRAAGVQASAPPPIIVVDTIAPGVWRIAGQTHHTIAIEQSNRIVLVEAPQSEARTLAVIAKARELAPPGKPVTMLVNTHHHYDHSGGFRAAVSQGLTVVTHQGNKDFYERTVFPGVHKSQPDALALNPRPLNLLVVGDRHTMRDELRPIEIHHVPGNPHNGSMLVVFLPAEKVLIQADLYNPPASTAPPPPGFPFVANLVENVQKRGLQVERVVGIHGRPLLWSELVAAASANR